MNNHQILTADYGMLRFTRPFDYNLPSEEKPVADFISTEQLYIAVFENAFHPMYIANDYGQILVFNEKLLHLFEYSEEEMKEFQFAGLFDVNEDPFNVFLNQRNESGIAKAEITGIKKSGEKFPLRISSVIYDTEKGEKRSMTTVVNISSNLSARWNIAG